MYYHFVQFCTTQKNFKKIETKYLWDRSSKKFARQSYKEFALSNDVSLRIQSQNQSIDFLCGHSSSLFLFQLLSRTLYSFPHLCFPRVCAIYQFPHCDVKLTWVTEVPVSFNAIKLFQKLHRNNVEETILFKLALIFFITSDNAIDIVRNEFHHSKVFLLFTRYICMISLDFLLNKKVHWIHCYINLI